MSLLLDDDSKDFEGVEVNDTQKENFEIDEQDQTKNRDMSGVAEETKPEGNVGTISNPVLNPEVVPVVNPSSIQDDVLGAISNPISNMHASAVDPTSYDYDTTRSEQINDFRPVRSTDLYIITCSINVHGSKCCAGGGTSFWPLQEEIPDFSFKTLAFQTL